MTNGNAHNNEIEMSIMSVRCILIGCDLQLQADEIPAFKASFLSLVFSFKACLIFSLDTDSKHHRRSTTDGYLINMSTK